MKVLIPMAGFGSRFKRAGYDGEKFEILFHGRTLFEWALTSLQNFFSDEFIFITRDLPHIRQFIEEKTADLGIEHYDIVTLDHPTRGQAETTIMADPFFPEDDSVLIFNVDTYINPNCLLPTQIRGAGWIPVFRAEGDHWSFVAADADGRACEVSEKVRISEHCSLGLYYFDSYYHYRELVKRYEAGDTPLSSQKEWYIAPLYNYIIQEGGDVFIQIIPSDQVMVLGTPEEIAAAEERF